MNELNVKALHKAIEGIMENQAILSISILANRRITNASKSCKTLDLYDEKVGEIMEEERKAIDAVRKPKQPDMVKIMESLKDMIQSTDKGEKP